jgi:hypothetical protein
MTSSSQAIGVILTSEHGSASCIVSYVIRCNTASETITPLPLSNGSGLSDPQSLNPYVRASYFYRCEMFSGSMDEEASVVPLQLFLPIASISLAKRDQDRAINFEDPRQRQRKLSFL